MLLQELPRIDSSPLDRGTRWLTPALIVAAAVSGAVVLLLVGYPAIAIVAVAAGAIGAALSMVVSTSPPPVPEIVTAGLDYSLVGSVLGLSRDPVALTDGHGSLLLMNPAYRERFGAARPVQLAADEDAQEGLRLV